MPHPITQADPAEHIASRAPWPRAKVTRAKVTRTIAPWLLTFVFAILGGCSSSTYRAKSEYEEITVKVEATFTGNKAIWGNTLLRTVEDYMYDLSRNPDREATIYDAALDVEDAYREIGYPDVKVSYEIQPAKFFVVSLEDEERDEPVYEDGLRVVFTIVEGQEVTLRSISLKGNDHRKWKDLQKLWVRTHAGFFGFGDPLFVATELETFASSIKSSYHLQGYLDATVKQPDIEREAGSDVADVTIEIHEGDPFTIGTITLPETIRRALGDNAPRKPEGAVASATTVQSYQLQVRSRLLRTGYPDSRITLTPKKGTQADEGNKTVDLIIGGEAGRHGTIAEIVFEGHSKTRAWVIENQVRFALGDVYDSVEVDETLRKLYLTGLFSKVTIRHEWIGGNKLRLRIALEERKSRIIDFLVGYGSYERFRGMVRAEEANLFGTGRLASFETRISTKGYRSILGFTDPRLFNSKTAMTVTGEMFEIDQPSYLDKAEGTSISFSREIISKLRGILGYRYFKRDGSRVSTSASQFEDFIEGAVFTDIRKDRRNHIISPTSGYLAFGTAELVDPAFGADVAFTKLQAGFRGFVPLDRQERYRLALRAELGFIFPGEDDLSVPVQKRFFNGGPTSVRSFNEDQLGPKDSGGTPTGGQFRNLFSTEFRGPIYKVLEWSAFADAGNVGLRVQDYGLQNMRYGIGAGLRIALPIGPIRCDAAINPDARSGEEEWNVFLTVGYPF